MMFRVNTSAPATTTEHPRPAARRVRRPRRPRGLHGTPPPAAPRQYRWGRGDTWSTAIIAVLALFTRFIGLTNPVSKGSPVFDEKHYVPQAWDMVRSWDSPFLGGIELNPGYGLVVHPPLGKQILALSEAVFGYTPLGWRFATALFGAGTVVMVMALARRISLSWQVAAFAGFIACFDGVLLVSSKFGMLDIFQVFFITAAAWALARDHHQMHERLHRAYVRDGLGTSEYGPRFGFRWWRFTAGVFLGLALAVKWSGLYFIAAFGLLTVFSDLALRRRYGVRRYVAGTVLRDVAPAFASIVILPAALYVWSWRAWFGSETAVYRHAKEDGTIEAGSLLNLLPDSVANWLYYHKTVLEFHASLTSSGGHHHPWDSKPWAWLVGARPVLYYSSTDAECAGGQECRRMLMLFGTPVIWWIIVPVLIWALWSLTVRRDRRFLIPLVGFAAGFFPWLVGFDRQMYFFYAAAFIPFVIVAIALILGQLSGRGREVPWRALRTLAGGHLRTGTLAVIVYLCAVLAMFVYFSPLLYGFFIPESWYNSLMWLPSWH